ncbi:MAG TPA: hypothetical protein VH475_16825 [Tepidisphaeraceae bacterium]|jgi:uncharacterized delta-60 repeat protein
MQPVHSQPFLEVLEARRLLAAGDLDASFGTGGVIVFPGEEQAETLAIQADGKILLSNPSGLHRFNPDGSPDTSWGRGGLLKGFGSAFALDSAGRIVISLPNNQQKYGVARLMPDGSYDPTFGNGGQVITQVGDTLPADFGSVVGIDGSGRIIVLGSKLVQPADPSDPDSRDVYEHTIVRFIPDGSVDTSFAGDGEYTSRNIDRLEGAAVADDGRVVLHGQVNIGQSTHDGQYELISATGQQLKVTPDSGGSTFTYGQDRAAVFRPDGTLAIGSSSVGFSGVSFDDRFTQLFFNPLDPDDATDGYINDVVNAGANKILVAGYGGDTPTPPTGGTGLGLARLNADGTPDKTFGFGGVEEIDLNRRRSDWIDRLAVAPDGSIYAAGFVGRRGDADFEYGNGPNLFLAKFEGGSRTLGSRPPVANYNPFIYPARPSANAATHEIKVAYAAEDLIDKTTLDNYDIRIVGPNGFSERARLIGVKDQYDGQRRIASYAIDAPGGTWNRADNGYYTVYLRRNQVYDNFGHPVPAQVFGQFKTYFPRGRHHATTVAASSAIAPALSSPFSTGARRSMTLRKHAEFDPTDQSTDPILA